MPSRHLSEMCSNPFLQNAFSDFSRLAPRVKGGTVVRDRAGAAAPSNSPVKRKSRIRRYFWAGGTQSFYRYCQHFPAPRALRTYPELSLFMALGGAEVILWDSNPLWLDGDVALEGGLSWHAKRNRTGALS